MNAELVMRDERVLDEDLWVELVVWRVPLPVRNSLHPFKYRLALIDRNVCVLRYDNEAGKGDHKHVGEEEVLYAFSTIPKLLRDFAEDAESYRNRRAKR